MKWNWKLRETNLRHNVFVRTMIPYLIFMIMLLGIGYIVYNETIQVMEKEVTENHMLALDQSRDILEKRLDEVSEIGRQLGANTKVMQFSTLTEPFMGANTFSVIDTIKSLYDYKLSNNFVYNYYILFKNSDLVLTPGSVYTTDEFFNQIAVYEGSTMEEMRQKWLKPYHIRTYMSSSLMTKNGSYSILTYLQSIGYVGNSQAVIAVLIDQSEIRKLFHGLNLSDGGWAYILDDQGNIISTLSGNSISLPLDPSSLKDQHGIIEQKLDSQSIIVTYTKSSVNGWTYLVGQPKAVLLGKVNYIRKIVFSLTLFILIVGVTMAYLLANRNSKPLRKLVDSVRELVGGGVKLRDGFGFINEAVSVLAQSNLLLKSELDGQVPLLRASYFRRLMKGEFLSSHDAEALMKHLGLDILGIERGYVIAIVRIKGYDNAYNESLLTDLDRVRFGTVELLREIAGNDGFACDVAEDQIAILFSYRLTEREHYRGHIEMILSMFNDAIHNRFKVVTACGIGTFFDRLTSISRSYEQAKEALYTMERQQKEGYLWFDMLPKAVNDYLYPQDIEGRLMNVAMAGESDEVIGVLTAIHKENFEVRHLSPAVLRLLISEMWGTLVKLFLQLGMQSEEVYVRMQRHENTDRSYESLQQHFEAIRDTYIYICKNVNDQRSSRNLELIENTRRLLQEAFGEKEMCLDVAADRLRVSKIYLSQFFKDQTGINFSDYLEGLRMDQAKQLLQRPELAIHEIADQVGYYSSNTFCRAFKRIHGVSATAYQKSLGVHI